MRIDGRPGISGPALVPAQDPHRSAQAHVVDPFMAFAGFGTGRDLGAPLGSRTSTWLNRWQRWRRGFEQRIGPQARKFWALYRAFDGGPIPGPGQEWRDRTVIPECFKIIETRLPRIVMSQFGSKEDINVEGRDDRDEQYEEMVRVLMEETLDEIGRADQIGAFLKRFIDGMRYREIMGHVFFKTWWRTEKRYIKTKFPVPNTDGSTTWMPIQQLQTIYDNIDFMWLGLSDLAIDLTNGPRRWAIERVQTSLYTLVTESQNYERENGKPLYKNLDLLKMHASSVPTRESFEEPRDTERWPLTEAQLTGGWDNDDRPVELWICWDNLTGMCTKIADRSIELDYGLSPTPDGLDPYISSPSVPIPGRVYGDSILHWTGPLATYQTRIARARADEVLLNIWQQFIYREGSIRSTQLFWRPGAGMAIDHPNPDRPITDSVYVFPRRPVFQEAWQEEGYRQQQQEATAGADAVTQGVEATNKSRDVSATEIQQRVLQGSSRFQLENLYNEVSFKRPFLYKTFDLLRMNLTSPRSIRVLNTDMTVDLRNLDRNVDFKLGSGLFEITKKEREQQADQLVNIAQTPVFGPYLRPREILLDLFEVWGRKNKNRFVKSDEQVQQAQAAMMQPPQMGGGRGPQQRTPAPQTPTAPQVPAPGGAAGEGSVAGTGGASPQPSPSESGTLVAEI